MPGRSLRSCEAEGLPERNNLGVCGGTYPSPKSWDVVSRKMPFRWGNRLRKEQRMANNLASLGRSRDSGFIQTRLTRLQPVLS
jgi:hypothetical protein